MSTVRVCIPNTKRDYFDYLTPTGETIDEGTRVLVPFRTSERVGIVIGQGTPEEHITLKPIHTIIDKAPLLDTKMLALYHWMAQYYHAPLSDVLTLALPKKYREGKEVTPPPPQSSQKQPWKHRSRSILSKLQLFKSCLRLLDTIKRLFSMESPEVVKQRCIYNSPPAF